jgi:hypothetical protein
MEYSLYRYAYGVSIYSMREQVEIVGQLNQNVTKFTYEISIFREVRTYAEDTDDVIIN